MPNELARMISRICPLNWNTGKLIELLIVCTIALAWFVARRKRELHITLMLLAWAGFMADFTHGAMLRGVTGSIGKKPHEWYWHTILSVHIAAGVLYGIGGLLLICTTGWKLRHGPRGVEPQTLVKHRRWGKRVAMAGFGIFLFGLPF